jgi:hypothetical protein
MTSPEQRDERKRSHPWIGRLSTWFRSLGNPKKVASIAGGLATALAITTGLITVGGAVISALNTGREALTRENIPPMPQYDKSEVQEAIAKQQQAVQEYAYPYTPPEQLKAPEENGKTAGIIKGVQVNHIRADYQYLCAPAEGVVVGKFNPSTDPRRYMQEGLVAYSYPYVWTEVTSKVKLETVTVSPYLVVEVARVRAMPERANYVVYPPGGGGAQIRHLEAPSIGE